MPKKIFILLFSLIFLCGTGCYFYKTPNDFGQTFNSETELFLSQNKQGYEFLGKFDVHFPGTVTSVQNSKNAISFIRNNGTPHTYQGFDGYALKVVRLNTTSGEMIYVFKSIKKN